MFHFLILKLEDVPHDLAITKTGPVANSIAEHPRDVICLLKRREALLSTCGLFPPSISLLEFLKCAIGTLGGR